MKAICVKRTMHKGVVYMPGDVYLCESGPDKPANFRWEHEDSTASTIPVPERGSDTLLIIGDAPCLMQDVAKLDVPVDREVLAVNRAAFRWQAPVHYWASVHADMLSEWKIMWDRMGYGRGVKPHFFVSRESRHLPDASLVGNMDNGGSLSEALSVAAKLGHKDIYIAGAPLVESYSTFAAPSMGVVQRLRSSGVNVYAASGALAGE